jgi:hypothetical protein
MDKPHLTPAAVRRITERVMSVLEINPIWITPIERVAVHAAIAKIIMESCGEEGCDEDWLCHLAMRIYSGRAFVSPPPIGRPLIEKSRASAFRSPSRPPNRLPN